MVDATGLLIIGANGQLGKALQQQYPRAKAVDMGELDISDSQQLDDFDWSGIQTVFNAAAYTNVDGAETTEGRVIAWQANAAAPRNLARKCLENDMTLVHISSDYVFDGSHKEHLEDEPFSPLSVYGASKAGGDIAVSELPKHYIVRTSWVIGDGKNFVRTMLELGKRGIEPSVVSDQIGRLTFTSELVKAIDHILQKRAEFGTYNISNNGESVSWAEITRAIFTEAGLTNKVTDITTKDYYKNKEGVAPRPLQSTLDLSKIKKTGFITTDWRESLAKYLRNSAS